MMAAAPPSTRERQHLSGLDGLRGLATLLVVVYHHALTTGYGRGTPLRVLRPLTDSGWIGVDLFFALSGFLVTGILLRKQGTPGYLREFYRRRALRIAPLYFVYIALMLYVVPALVPASHPLSPALQRPLENQVWLWTLTVNLWMAATDSLIGGALEPCWSLCVEAHYYLMWPFVVRWAGARRLPAMCIGLWLASSVARALLLAMEVSPRALYFATPTRLDDVFAGALVASLLWTEAGRTRLERWARPAMLTAGVGLCGLLVIERGLHERAPTTPLFAYGLLAVAAGGLVAQAQAPGSPAMRLLSLRPLRWLGHYSYAIYLFNLPLLAYVHGALPANLSARPVVVLALAGAACLALAWLSYRYLEGPLLRHRPAPRPKPDPTAVE